MQTPFHVGALAVETERRAIAEPERKSFAIIRKQVEVYSLEKIRNNIVAKTHVKRESNMTL